MAARVEAEVSRRVAEAIETEAVAARIQAKLKVTQHSCSSRWVFGGFLLSGRRDMTPERLVLDALHGDVLQEERAALEANVTAQLDAEKAALLQVQTAPSISLSRRSGHAPMLP